MDQQQKIKSDLQAYVASLQKQLDGYSDLQAQLRSAQKALSAFEPEAGKTRNGKTGKVLLAMQTFDGPVTMEQIGAVIPHPHFTIAKLVKRGVLISRRDPSAPKRSLYMLANGDKSSSPEIIVKTAKVSNRPALKGAPTQLSRAVVYEAIAAAGPDGARMSELKDVLGKSPNTISYHSDILRKNGFVQTRGKLTGTRWFAVKKYVE